MSYVIARGSMACYGVICCSAGLCGVACVCMSYVIAWGSMGCYGVVWGNML